MLEFIREKILSGDFSFTTHAIIEAAEDELTGDDVLYVIQRGGSLKNILRGVEFLFMDGC